MRGTGLHSYGGWQVQTSGELQAQAGWWCRESLLLWEAFGWMDGTHLHEGGNPLLKVSKHCHHSPLPPRLLASAALFAPPGSCSPAALCSSEPGPSAPPGAHPYGLGSGPLGSLLSLLSTASNRKTSAPPVESGSLTRGGLHGPALPQQEPSTMCPSMSTAQKQNKTDSPKGPRVRAEMEEAHSERRKQQTAEEWSLFPTQGQLPPSETARFRCPAPHWFHSPLWAFTNSFHELRCGQHRSTHLLGLLGLARVPVAFVKPGIQSPSLPHKALLGRL